MAAVAPAEAEADGGDCDGCSEVEQEACVAAFLKVEPNAERAFDFEREDLDKDASDMLADTDYPKEWSESWDDDGGGFVIITQDGGVHCGGGGSVTSHYTITATVLGFCQ